MPWWTGVLEAAAEWGCAPWEIAPGGKFLWYARWTAYRGTINRAEAERAKKRAKKKT